MIFNIIISFLTGIPLFGFGLYFIIWEIAYKDLSEFLAFGIIFMLIGCLAIVYAVSQWIYFNQSRKSSHTKQQTSGMCTKCGKLLYPDTSIEWDGQTYCTSCFKPMVEKMFADIKRMKELQQEITRLQSKKEELLQEKSDQLKKIETTLSTPVSPQKEKSSSRLMNYFEDETGEGWYLKYEYEKDICFIDTSAKLLEGKSGKQLEFRPEPENTYDPGAVAIYLDDQKIGYVYKGYVQDMIRDWTKRGEMFEGHILSVDVSNNTAAYIIGFYKTEDFVEHKEFDLIKTNKKDYLGNLRSDRLCFCQEGNEVIIEYDSSIDSFVVYNDMYEELGELGTKFRQWEEENSYNKVFGIISHISDEDIDNPKLKIKVILV